MPDPLPTSDTPLDTSKFDVQRSTFDVQSSSSNSPTDLSRSPVIPSSNSPTGLSRRPVVPSSCSPAEGSPSPVPWSLGPLVSWSRTVPCSFLLGLAALGLLWADLIRQLGYMWSTNEQYAFGWFVPILALGLFLKKWPTRPGGMQGPKDQETKRPKDHQTTLQDEKTKRPKDQETRIDQETKGPKDQETSGPSAADSVPAFEVQRSTFDVRSSDLPATSSDGPLVPWSLGPLVPCVSRLVLWSLGLLVLFALLPLRIIHDVNQDWALITWSLTLSVIAITLYAIYRLGGWPWVKHFAFPICFILVAVRWPYRLENSLTYRLMTVVTDLTVDLLGWIGISTLQHGHVIEVATGMVGVDEACSGIRSFQSSLMAGLFLGELYYLRFTARTALVLGSVVAAFAFNLLRTILLTWQANAHGLSAIDRWHDSAGLSITVACFVVLWVMAALFRTRWSSAPLPVAGGQSNFPASSPSPATNTQQTPTANEEPTANNQQPPTDNQELTANTQQPATANHFPSWFSYGLAVWVPVVIVANEAWYRSHDTAQNQAPTWSVSFPTNLPGAQEIPISKLAREKLKYDEATTLAWEEPDGSKWSAFHFRWNAGAATSRLAARDHRPEYCLGGSGYNCKADLGVRYLPAHGLEFPFRPYVYERSGLILYVFHCIWEEGAEKQEGFGLSKYLDRLKAVMQGKRRLGQQTLQVIVTGCRDMAQALNALRARLPDLVKIENRTSPNSH